MDSPEPTTHSPRGWAVSGLLLLGGAVYMSAFWGNVAKLLPAPVDRWAYVYVPLLKPWWVEHVLTSWSVADRMHVLWLVVNVVAGLLVPAVLLRLCGWKLTDLGIGRPNALGRRIIGAGVAGSIPFGFWLAAANPKIVQSSITVMHVCGALSMIPEHFLICGVYVALMLPGRRLPDAVPLAPVEGGPFTRSLRWLGLAQPASDPDRSRLLAWFGLTGVSLAAVLASGLLFGMVHIGKGWLELALSFPGGVTVAYMTLRSHSVWPAIAAHLSMNVIPMGIWLSFR